MKRSNLLARTVLLALALVAVVVGAAYLSPAVAGRDAAHVASTELEWHETPFGPVASPVDGDFSSGAHVTYIKFPAGMATPMHTHTSDYVGIVVSGTTRHWIPGRPETKKELPPGSHWFIPGGERHVSECLPGMECVMASSRVRPWTFCPRKSCIGKSGAGQRCGQRCAGGRLDTRRAFYLAS